MARAWQRPRARANAPRPAAHHQRVVEAGTNPRDVKVFDDGLRYAILDFCQPCTMEEMFPLHRLGDAKSAVCMALVLRDGTIAYGDARPRACR